ncbi:MAG TPA: sugar ABC transporter permease [Chloroflexota bacterium]|nr:sugar ABC transporter permease [Chloroflexota bacterium]
MPNPVRGLLYEGSVRRQRTVWFYVFVSPWIVGFLLWHALPMLASLALSFARYDAISAPRFIGVQNYTDMVADPLTWQSLKVTAIYTVGAVGVTLVGSLLLASLLNQRLPLLGLWRTIFYLPVVTSGVAVALLWSWLLQPDFGLVNAALLNVFGIHGPRWFTDQIWVVPSFILMASWSVGGPMLIYLAAMQGVPTQLHEAAKIDGAGAVARYWFITLPMISPAIFFNLVLSVIASFQVFTPAFIITQGGPNYGSYFFVLHLYEYAFSYFKLGYASALAWLLFVIVLLFTLALFRWSFWVYYEGEARA